MSMKNQLTAFSIIVLVGFTAILLAVYAALVLKRWGSIVDILAVSGIWLIMSFLILVGAHGACLGIHKTNVQIPKRIAIIVFTVASLLFVAAAILNSGF